MQTIKITVEEKGDKFAVTVGKESTNGTEMEEKVGGSLFDLIRTIIDMASSNSSFKINPTILN